MTKPEKIWREILLFLREKKFLSHHPKISPEEFDQLVQTLEKKLPKKLPAKKKKSPSPSKKVPLDIPPCLDLVIYTDGASRGNPGPAGIGVVISQRGGETLWEGSRALGQVTNNVAEYRALLWAIEKALELKPAKVAFFLDSQLIVNQIRGIYKVKHPGLRPIYEEAMEKLSGLSFSIEHVPRAQNSHADQLANRGIDEGTF